MSNTRLWRRKYCPRCEETVSKSAYYRHRAEYFDSVTNKWRKTARRHLPYSEAVVSTDVCSEHDIYGTVESQELMTSSSDQVVKVIAINIYLLVLYSYY